MVFEAALAALTMIVFNLLFELGFKYYRND